jgi:hypothetical protein
LIASVSHECVAQVCERCGDCGLVFGWNLKVLAQRNKPRIMLCKLAGTAKRLFKRCLVCCGARLVGGPLAFGFKMTFA